LLPIGLKSDIGSRLSVVRFFIEGGVCQEGGRRNGEGKGNGEARTRTFCAVVVAVDVEDPDGALVSHALLGDAYHLGIVVRKADALDGRREFPFEEAFACLHGPKPHRVVRRARNKKA
jgi:hypothetical protein